MVKTKSGFSAKKRKELAFYIAIMALPVLQAVVFYFYVNLNSFMLAFQEFDGTGVTGYRFVGFETFKKVFTLEHSIFKNFNFGLVAKNSAISFLVGICCGFIPSLFFSYYIYKNHIGSSAFKIILYIPHIIPQLVFVIVYKYFMNDFLASLGIVKIGYWTSTVEAERFYYLFFGWMIAFGTSVLVYTGSMSGISDSIIESGQLDGITPVKEFFYIVLPMIWGTFVTMTISTLLGFFTSDMHGYAFKAAGFNTQLQTFGYFLQNKTINGGMSAYPVLSALGLIMTVLAVPVTIMTRKLMLKYGPRTD
jgi:ABC-type sugar transport system permease subunit